MTGVFPPGFAITVGEAVPVGLFTAAVALALPLIAYMWDAKDEWDIAGVVAATGPADVTTELGEAEVMEVGVIVEPVVAGPLFWGLSFP